MFKRNIKNKKNMFILLSPLHFYITETLIKYLNIKEVVIVCTEELKDLVKGKYENVIIMEYPKKIDKEIKKILILKKNLFFKIKEKFEAIYTPMDYDIYIQAFLKNNKFNEINLFEEGGTLYYLLTENRSRNIFVKKIKKILKFILGLECTENILTSNKIKDAYMFFPDELKSFNSKIHYIDLNLIIERNGEKIEVENKYKNVDYLILTQPLTEDGITTNKIEVEVIRKFIQPEKNYLIKLHPRDSEEKYEEILSLGNVKLLDNKYQNIPYQVLHYSLNPKNIVSHFSSVLYTTPSIREDFKRIALVRNLKNEKILETVKIMSKYINIEIR